MSNETTIRRQVSHTPRPRRPWTCPLRPDLHGPI